MIQFNNLAPSIAPIRGDINRAVERVIDSGIFLGGEEVAAFEEEWATYCGAKHCVACASGTDALMLAARIFDADKLAIAANGCAFTVRGLRHGGSSVEFFDVDDRGHCNSHNVVATLLYGRQWQPYSEDSRVLIDACQAHGWKPLKNSLVAWSGYPTKNLGGFGDCGWITVPREKDAQIARERAAYWHSRMSELNAAVLRTKLPHLDRWNAMRHAIAEVYYNELPDWAEPACRHGEPTNHHIFAVLVNRRNDLEMALRGEGIGAKVHYPEPLAELPGARRWTDRTLSLPCWPGMTPQQVQTVCDVMKGSR